MSVAESARERPPLPRPDRPAWVELAAAILIVGGIVSIVGRIGAALAGAEVPPGAELGNAVLGTFDLLTVTIGVLVRSGRAWVASMNVVVIATFLYLTAFPNPIALFFAAVFGLVLVVLLVNRPWFDAVKAWRSANAERRR